MGKPATLKLGAGYLQERHGLSQRRAALLAGRAVRWCVPLALSALWLRALLTGMATGWGA